MHKRPTPNQERSFRHFFGKSTSVYWNPLFGFDIVQFDADMQSEQGYVEDGKTSLREFLVQKFGQEASDLVNSLIGGV
jgi:hypothetical protein